VSWIFLVLLAAGHEASAQDLTTMSGTITTPRDSLRVLGPAVPVVLVASSHISKSLLNRICAETTAIWKPAGITFEWHRATTTDRAGTSWLEVTIDEGRKDVHAGQAALGWIPFTEDRPLPSIHLSLSNAEELLLRTPGVEDKTISTHETLLGRALGRALSHELGHYLLRSKLHTPDGLMRAVRSSEQFFRISRDGFEPSPKEREAAALHVRQDSRPRVTCDEVPDDGCLRIRDHDRANTRAAAVSGRPNL
jgi:hypothetical protein